MKEIVPLGSPIFKVLRDGRKILFVKCDLHTFCLDLAEGILRILHLIFLGLHLETIAVFVVIVLKEFLEDDVLVLLQYSCLAVYEGREQAKILCCQFASSHP